MCVTTSRDKDLDQKVNHDLKADPLTNKKDREVKGEEAEKEEETETTDEVMVVIPTDRTVTTETEVIVKTEEKKEEITVEIGTTKKGLMNQLI